MLHPQLWGAQTDSFQADGIRDKKVVVIGSGATAITLIPSIASKAKHVTMLQRSPSYIMTRENHNSAHAELLEKYPPLEAHEKIRMQQMQDSKQSRTFY